MADCFGKPENGYFELASGMPRTTGLREGMTPKKTKSLARLGSFLWGRLVAERLAILSCLIGRSRPRSSCMFRRASFLMPGVVVNKAGQMPMLSSDPRESRIPVLHFGLTAPAA